MTYVEEIADLKGALKEVDMFRKIYYKQRKVSVAYEKRYASLSLAIKAVEQISHLKDRPCEACEFYTEEGCSKWECVFEGSDAE